jgi:hypothetical protein
MYMKNGLPITESIEINEVVYPPNFWAQANTQMLADCGVSYAADPVPIVSVPTAREIALGQIPPLEWSITPRRLRDAILTPAGAAWLAAVEAQINALRATP